MGCGKNVVAAADDADHGAEAVRSIAADFAIDVFDESSVANWQPTAGIQARLWWQGSTSDSSETSNPDSSKREIIVAVERTPRAAVAESNPRDRRTTDQRS